MRAFIVSLIAILICVPLFGQTPQPTRAPGSQIATPFGSIPNAGAISFPTPPAKPEVDMSTWETRIFQTRFVDPSELRPLLSMFQCWLQAEPRLNALAVRAPKDVMPAIADTIQRFDVSNANSTRAVELTAYLILAAPEAGTGMEMPTALRPVIEQMRKIFNYKSYTAIDTNFMTVGQGDNFSTSGMLEKLSASDSFGPSYELRGRVIVSGEANDESVRVSNLICQFKGPFGADISTSIDLKKNQQVVVGKTTYKDRALILVMSAKVVE